MTQKKLLLISRARFRVVENVIYFQQMDGPYIDKIASFCQQITIMAPKVIEEDGSSNLTYKFRNKNIDVINRGCLSYFRTISLVTSLIKNHDVVFVFMPQMLSTVSTFIAKLFNKPIIYYSGGVWHEAILVKRKFNFIQRRFIEGLYKTLELLTIRMSSIRVLNNNVLFQKYKHLSNTEKTKPILNITINDFYYRNDTFQNNGVINIITVGHIKPGKGYIDLVKGFSIFKRTIKSEKVFLHIVGDYEKFSEIKNEIDKIISKEYLQENIIFYGIVTDKNELMALYRKMDVFVLASESEGFPRVLWEAMSQSLPIITTELDNIKLELMGYDNIVKFININSPNDLCLGLIDIYENKELRELMLKQQKTYLSLIFNEEPAQQLNRLLLTI